MMKVAVTGGIGSGKSFVCKRLNARGIEVYDCDRAAKRLMRTSVDIREGLTRLVGPDVYVSGVLNKSLLAQYLLASDAHKQAVNAVVHPAVAADFLVSGMEWLESAILFDSGFHHRIAFDHVLCVTAPMEVRIARVMARDGITREKTLEWIGRQLPQEEVLAHSDFELVNDGQADIDTQLDKIIRQIYSSDK